MIHQQHALSSPAVPAHRWAPLLVAGFGMMAGRSPYAAVNIGQGGLEGLKAAEGQQQRFDTRAEKQASVQEAANQLLETVNYHKGELDARNRQISEEAEKAQDANDIAGRRADIEQQQADTAARKVDQDRFSYQAGMGPDPNDPTKQTEGVWRFSTRQGDRPFFTPGATLTSQQKTNQTLDKSGPTIREWDATANNGQGGWKDTGIPTTAEERVQSQNQLGHERAAIQQDKVNQAIDKSGPTVREWDASTQSWKDTGIPTTAEERATAAKERADADQRRAANGPQRGGVTTAEQRINTEIDQARTQITSLGIPYDEIVRRSQPQINGRANPNYDPNLMATYRRAIQPKYGDDPGYTDFLGRMRGNAASPAATTPAASPTAPQPAKPQAAPPAGASSSRGSGDTLLGEDMVNGHLADIYQRPDGTHYAVPK